MNEDRLFSSADYNRLELTWATIDDVL